MTTWFTSDLHFGHKNIIKYCLRPFAVDPCKPTKADVETMNHALIENWNAVVQDGDMVWNLGDASFCCPVDQAAECLRQLHGHHNFIRGNHDDAVDELFNASKSPNNMDYRKRDIVEVQVEDQSIVLCHYAMREWHHCLRGVWHLFGHTHGCLPGFGKSVDVGVDNAHVVLGLEKSKDTYRPISFAELKAYMDMQPIGAHAQFERFEEVTQ